MCGENYFRPHFLQKLKRWHGSPHAEIISLGNIPIHPHQNSFAVQISCFGNRNHFEISELAISSSHFALSDAWPTRNPATPVSLTNAPALAGSPDPPYTI